MKPKLVALGLAVVVMTVYDVMAPDAKSFRTPELARILFWHLPCALLTTWFLFHAAYLGVRYLMSRDIRWDARLGTAVEMGALFGALTMATGIVFSWVQWGAPWQWDKRQTSFLMVLFLFALALAIRGGFVDDKKKAAVSSAYAVLSLLPSLFLIFVFPRLPQIEKESFHPSNTVVTNGIDWPYKIGLWGTFTVLALLAVYLYSLRVRGNLLAQRLEEKHGMDPTGLGRPAPTGVVRPVDVPQEH